MNHCHYPLNAFQGEPLRYCEREAVATVFKATWLTAYMTPDDEGQDIPWADTAGDYCAEHAGMVRRNNTIFTVPAVIIPLAI